MLVHLSNAWKAPNGRMANTLEPTRAIGIFILSSLHTTTIFNLFFVDTYTRQHSMNITSMSVCLFAFEFVLIFHHRRHGRHQCHDWQFNLFSFSKDQDYCICGWTVLYEGITRDFVYSSSMMITINTIKALKANGTRIKVRQSCCGLWYCCVHHSISFVSIHLWLLLPLMRR